MIISDKDKYIDCLLNSTSACADLIKRKRKSQKLKYSLDAIDRAIAYLEEVRRELQDDSREKN